MGWEEGSVHKHQDQLRHRYREYNSQSNKFKNNENFEWLTILSKLAPHDNDQSIQQPLRRPQLPQQQQPQRRSMRSIRSMYFNLYDPSGEFQFV